MSYKAKFIIFPLLLLAVTLASCGGSAPASSEEKTAAGSGSTDVNGTQIASADAENDTKDLVALLSNDVAAAIMKKDAKKLASYVHPVKGFRISPYGYVEPETDPVVSAERTAGLFSETDRIDWGISDENGNPVLLTPSEYFDQYVVSKYNTEGVRATDEYLEGTNLTEIYPDSVIVEHMCGEADGEVYDHVVLLIYESYNDNWYLTGLVPILVDN